MPDATPTKSSIPDVPPIGVADVVGGPPRDDAGCEGGGASFHIQKLIDNNGARIRTVTYL